MSTKDGRLPKRHRPGSSWRILAWSRGRGEPIEMHSWDYDFVTEFDELVIDSWFHLEQMDGRFWWMRIGDLHVNVIVGERGELKKLWLEGDGINIPFQGWEQLAEGPKRSAGKKL